LLQHNDLGQQQYQKTEKTVHKASNIFPQTPILLPKRPKKGLFFLSVLSHVAPGAFLFFAAEEVALILRNRVF